MPDEDEINLFDLAIVLLKYKKMILIACAATFFLMCGISLLMTNIYSSTARILIPQDSNGGISSALSGMSGIASLAGISVSGGAGAQYFGMLQSRTIADAIIDEFNLMEVYGQEFRTKTYSALKEHVNTSLDDENNIIEISVEDEDPKRAAAIANAYVEELKKLNVRLNLGTAGRERVFLEKRLASAKADLRKAEDNLKSFQEVNKTIRIDDQATAIIDAIANLKAEIANKEVELGVLLSYQTQQNPEVKALQEAIVQLKSQLRKLEENSGGSQAPADIFIATSEVPELAVQYTRLLRESKIQEALFELLTEQYEIAKISEARDTSTIQVLDEANVPDRKSKPKRSLIVILATFIVGLLSILFAFIRELIHRVAEEDPDRWRSLREHFSFRNK